MRAITQASLKGKRVLIRVDFNLPLDGELNITDDSRMVAALPTIKKVISEGGRAIILSHLGRPKNRFEDGLSLKHTIKHLSRLLSVQVTFCQDCIGKNTAAAVNKMTNGDVIVLENLRFYPEEKGGDEAFARKLASLGDVYINDAFGSAHRKHASTSIIAKFFPHNKYFGFLLAKEIDSLEKALNKPKRPFTAIIGGAKITGKIDVISELFKKVDNLIIGGAMAYTFAKAMGGDVGDSLIEEKKVFLAKKLIKEAKNRGVNLLLPSDSLNADRFNAHANTHTSNILSIKTGFMGLDIGPESIAKFSKTISSSKTLIWNGPMGVFEMKKFERGTKEVGEAICLATKNGAFSLVGGGDSVSAAKKFRLAKKVSYVSTGGGPCLNI